MEENVNLYCPYDKNGHKCIALELHLDNHVYYPNPCTPDCNYRRINELEEKIRKQKMEDKPMNEYKIVTVKHPNCNVPYTFSVPDHLALKAGDYVLCDTKTHAYPQVAQCITPSFRVSEDILKGLLNIAPTKLRPIVAYLSVEWCKEEKTEDEHE